MEARSSVKGVTTERKIDYDVIDGMFKDGFQYAAFGEYFRRSHGYKMFKVPANAEFTCPNWDSRLSSQGCIYCPSFARQFSHESMRRVMDSGLRKQMNEQIEYHKGTGAGEKFLVYLAFGTNTYKKISELEKIYDILLEHPDTMGLSVGTRPDCLPEEVLNLLEGYVESGYEIWVELGQQSMHYHTCEQTNRQHGICELLDVIGKVHDRGMLVNLFTILGLPYETPSEMIETARILSVVGADSVKIYPLLVMEKTRLAGYYRQGRYRPLSRTEYINLVADFLEHLSPKVLIQRISKDAGVEKKEAPEWNTHRFLVGPEIEKALSIRGTMQGSKHKIGLKLEELNPID
ncbi:MAG: TIGR01212 family radical SAM protein [Candidatus Altiarchaeota archaeon]|nr:TIGR01212 family radical SAM protein [Candidatus Altiarchaeota archaeon]